MKTTAEIIRARRKELGFMQADLADRVGVKAVQVSRWETGEVRNYRAETLARIAAALGLKLEDLVKAAPSPAETTLEEAQADLRAAHKRMKGGPQWTRLVRAIRRAAGRPRKGS